MNTTTTVGSAVFRKPFGAGSAPAWGAAAAAWVRRLQRMPLLLWSLVAAAALLAFFVHLLNEQVLRGQMLREEQRAAAMRPAVRAAAAVDARQHANLLLATRQPMTRP